MLIPIDSGHIEALASEKLLTISYFISFKKWFITCTLFIIVGWIFSLLVWCLPIIQQVLLLFPAWLRIVVPAWAVTMIRFPFFIK